MIDRSQAQKLAQGYEIANKVDDKVAAFLVLLTRVSEIFDNTRFSLHFAV